MEDMESDGLKTPFIDIGNYGVEGDCIPYISSRGNSSLLLPYLPPPPVMMMA